jgi:hypothetical protein
MLIGTTSIAIWNWDKWVKVMATGVWVTNLGFLIHSKYTHSTLLQTIVKSLFKYAMISDIAQVNNQST